jgi:hypothetical protein
MPTQTDHPEKRTDATEAPARTDASDSLDTDLLFSVSERVAADTERALDAAVDHAHWHGRPTPAQVARLRQVVTDLRYLTEHVLAPATPGVEARALADEDRRPSWRPEE